MRPYLLAAALVLAPFAGRASAQDVRVPGHWETRRDFAEAPGHWETRARSVWRPAGYVTETRTRNVAGHWEVDVAGNRYWIGGATVTERTQVYREGSWDTVRETVWVPGARSEREHQVWVPEHGERVAPACPETFAAAPSARPNPWDDTPRTQTACEPRVSVEPINGVSALAPTPELRRSFDVAPSPERLREPCLPTAPRPCPAPDPFARPLQPVTAPAPRPCKPLVLVEAEPEAPAPRVVYREPAPTVIYREPCEPRVVYREPCEPRVVYREPCEPCPPRLVVVVGNERCHDRWRPAPCAPPCGPRVGFGASVHVGGGVRVGVGVGVGGGGIGVGVGVGIRIGGGHHHR